MSPAETKRRIRAALKASRVTQRALARSLDVSPALVDHLITGRRGKQPSAKALRVMHHICKLADCSYSELWGNHT